MRINPFGFQEEAVAKLHEAIGNAHTIWRSNKPQVIIFSAPTGAGKTIVMTMLFEEIVFGHVSGVNVTA